MTQADVLEGLTPAFRTKVETVVELCRDAGFVVVPYQGYRAPAEQARLWAQSRSVAEVEQASARLRAAGAAFLADLMDKAHAGGGPRVTNALPGQSWHQFGRAADCYIESTDSGRALWRDRRMDGPEFGLSTQLYERFGRTVEGIGLTWGGRWELGDFGHVQMGRNQNPVVEFGGWSLVDAALSRAASVA